MTDQVTRCPSCDTSFVVSEVQLSAAAGAVRCGACLEVFEAKDYFIEAPIADLFASEQAGEAEVLSEAADHVEAVEAVAEQDVENGHSEGQQQEGGQEKGDQEDGQEVDGQEDAENSEMADSESLRFSHEGVVSDPLEADQDDVDHVANLEEMTGEESVAESPYQQVDDSEPQPQPQPQSQSQSRSQSREEQKQESGLESEVDFEIGEKLDEALGQIVESNLEEIVPDLQATAQTSGLLKWFAVSSLLLLTLALQYVWYERDKFAAQLEYRGYFEKFCNAAGCQLEPFSDVSLLKTNNLVVRTHPDREFGLTVDALLRNEAAYRQAFPGLYLRFADINGDTVAERTFLPNTYLAGEMAGLRFIPASTEVRLSLEIMDPGKEAVSYSLVAVAKP